ncbi:extracellular tyrosine-protein kinase PKDCC-like [Asterias amurensis]|uniref:extracellular tyrosine-protein kinase PKDCC-like n=1 Tax=Asterias amurensis TaxID=7602 RepID=UPI003AB5518B
MTRRLQRGILGAVTVSFTLWILGATFMLFTSGRSGPGVGTAVDTSSSSNPSVRILSPAEKRLTHLANLVSELRQEIGYRRRRVRESDEELARLKAKLDGPFPDSPSVVVPASQSAKFNLKRHLMDVHNTLDPVSRAFKTTPATTGKSGADKDIEARGGKRLDRPARVGSRAQLIRCRDINSIPDSQKEFVGSGFTKRVQKASLGGRYVALKTPLRDGPDMSECAKFGMGDDECFRLANFKVLKEIALLQQLQHPNIIKVLGYCLPGKIDTQESSHIATMATEYGEPITFLDLLKMSWEDRLRISLGVSRLLVYLRSSALGSLAIHDFKPSQFVRVDGEVKLVDLDDVDDQPRLCKTQSDCAINGSSSTVYLPCKDGKCFNYTDRMNVFSAYKIFFTLLPYETPHQLKPLMTDFVNKTGEALLGSFETHQYLEKILQLYQSGDYLYNGNDTTIPGSRNAYQLIEDGDLPKHGDYWCASSLHMGSPSCVLLAFDENEAKYLCDQDDQCRSFVMTSEKTWTGRTVIYLKKATGHMPVYSPGNMLYVQLT